MSSSDYREPTNEELWPQPPATPAFPASPSPGQAVAPHQPAPVPTPATASATADRTSFVLALLSMVMGIPISAIASGNAGLPGLLVAWIGIVLVNVVYAWGRRR
ncbi:MAG: hypothetical protein KIT69_02295 [Propionibacteriaceae bacterium]|nr:hypothetical protein [Propionibacteriaceae bacterium]